MRFLKSLVILGSLLATPAHAWDGTVQGKIAAVQVSDAENAGFRVSLDNGASLCGTGTANWAYINKSFDNYDVMVSILTSAWLSGKSVTLYTTKEAGSNHCRIGHVLALG